MSFLHPPDRLQIRQTGFQFFAKGLLPLMRIIGQSRFFRCEGGKKREAAHAVSRNSVLVDFSRPSRQLAKIVPVEFSPVLKFLDEGLGIERVAGLPQFDDDHSADDG